MKALYLDTSGAGAGLMFMDGDAARALKSEGRQSENIFAAIGNVLGGVKIADLDFAAIITGPGSFTGIRLGLAIAKGFRIAAGIPVFGISVFEAVHISTGMTEIAIPAGGDEVYYAVIPAPSPVVPAPAFARAGSAGIPCSWTESLLGHPNPGIPLAMDSAIPRGRRNDGLMGQPQLLKSSALPPGVEILPEPQSAVDPAKVLDHIAKSGAAPGPLEPLYIKPHYAEVSAPSRHPDPGEGREKQSSQSRHCEP